ncbi:MAG: CDP-diacylglycerol--glycerol-3-phosphate 3-phosphatidyltransferase [Pseudomonadales bacterium]|nr:CDP-diacylglycerol--glycerol-3-phosphate 3-phosphatidyltransferase [Pseudomonadales bacterium]
MSLPNVITIARILLIPIFVLTFLGQWEWRYLATAVLFGLAAATDWLDGYLARRLNQTTPFGAFLDPVADKLIVVTALVLLIAHHSNIWLTLPALVIVGREIVISALREWMAEMNRSVAVAVSLLGKIKTTLQMVAIAVLLANPPDFGSVWVMVGYVLIYVAAFMTLWSMSVYLGAAWPTLRDSFNSSKGDWH